MEISKFNTILNDKYFTNLKKLQYKYEEDFNEYYSIYKNTYCKQLPLTDFNGNNIFFSEIHQVINCNIYKTLLMYNEKPYGNRAVENEIISTSLIEKIDYSRDSVRNILKGYAPVTDEENRIMGMKKGFDFISDKSNKITEENIYSLYMTSIGNYLEDENKPINNNKYRHSSVVICDGLGNISHCGINSDKIKLSMKKLIDFINTKDELNDLIKSAIIHFYISYIHPYFDGNGRMARFIHLWFLIQKGYTSALIIPFSELILKSLKQYYNAFSLTEENQKISGILDVTPFISYFTDNIYNKIDNSVYCSDTFENYNTSLKNGEITPKEDLLWKFIVSQYGTDEFSTKQLEKDYGDVAYATVRSFVLKFKKLNLLSSRKFSNRIKYKIIG